MPKIKLITSNSRIALLFTIIIIAFTLATVFFPLLLIRIIPQSGIGNYFLEHLYYGYFSIPIILYVIYTGIFSYSIKIDSHIIDVRSFRTISGIFKPPNYIDIAHTMLSEFAFFNRPLSLNTTLMIKVKTDSGKLVVRRFNLTFLSKKEQQRISEVLKKIIARNS